MLQKTTTYTCQNYGKHESFVMGIQYSSIISTLMLKAAIGEKKLLSLTTMGLFSYKVTPWNYKYGWRR